MVAPDRGMAVLACSCNRLTGLIGDRKQGLSLFPHVIAINSTFPIQRLKERAYCFARYDNQIGRVDQSGYSPGRNVVRTGAAQDMEYSLFEGEGIKGRQGRARPVFGTYLRLLLCHGSVSPFFKKKENARKKDAPDWILILNESTRCADSSPPVGIGLTPLPLGLSNFGWTTRVGEVQSPPAFCREGQNILVTRV